MKTENTNEKVKKLADEKLEKVTGGDGEIVIYPNPEYNGAGNPYGPAPTPTPVVILPDGEYEPTYGPNDPYWKNKDKEEENKNKNPYTPLVNDPNKYSG